MTKAPDAPSRQCCRKKCIGERQCVKHRAFQDVSWYTPAPISPAAESCRPHASRMGVPMSRANPISSPTPAQAAKYPVTKITLGPALDDGLAGRAVRAKSSTVGTIDGAIIPSIITVHTPTKAAERTATSNTRPPLLPYPSPSVHHVLHLRPGHRPAPRVNPSAVTRRWKDYLASPGVT